MDVEIDSNKLCVTWNKFDLEIKVITINKDTVIRINVKSCLCDFKMS